MIFFFFNDTATTEIYTLSLHDALPIYPLYARPLVNRNPAQTNRNYIWGGDEWVWSLPDTVGPSGRAEDPLKAPRSEEHTSELQSRQYLVCRLLLEKKKTNHIYHFYSYS